MRIAVLSMVLLTLLCASLTLQPAVAQPAAAPVTPEQRQQLAGLSREVGEVAKMLRKKELEEAEKALTDIESRLDALVAGGVPATDRLVTIIKNNITARRRTLALQRGEKPNLGVSFSEDVAPIIKANCLSCHGNDARGGLKLDTFAGWKQGGASKQPLIIPGAAQLSPMMGRLILPGATRMPKGKPPLSPTEIQTIARWVQEGAKFDGKSDNSPIGEQESDEPEPMITVAKPTGTETVSFTKDVAPVFVNICGQCHAGNNPRGGFNMATFEGILRGGESGPVLEPGNPDASRLWLMVSNKEQPRMPPGQLLITRTNYDALTTWIKEGLKFDGNDPKAPLRNLIPTDAEMKAADLAQMSPAEFATHRKDRSLEQWKKTYPGQMPQIAENAEVIVLGNVEENRLQEIAGWAATQASDLKSAFGDQETPLWKGKLAIFIFQERFGFDEFALAVERQDLVPPDVHGLVTVTANQDNAYIALEDVGDSATTSNSGLQPLLARLMTEAYFGKEGGKLPRWLQQGTGWYLASKGGKATEFFNEMFSTSSDALKKITKPEQLYEEGTFSPSQAPAVGFAFVEYLIRTGGQAKFSAFLKRAAQTGDVPAALEAAYRTTPAAIAIGFGQSPRRGR